MPRERIAFERATWTFEHPGRPAELLSIFRDFYGPTMNAYAAAEQSGRAVELQRELEGLFTSRNASPCADTTSIPATFLRVSVAV